MSGVVFAVVVAVTYVLVRLIDARTARAAARSVEGLSDDDLALLSQTVFVDVERVW